MNRIAATVLSLAVGLLALLFLSGCTNTPEKAHEVPQLQKPSISLDYTLPEEGKGFQGYDAPKVVEPPHVPAPDAKQAPEGEDTRKAPKSSEKALEGDDNGDGRIDEDESGWDCANMGNGQGNCLNGKALEPPKVACRGAAGTDVGDLNRNGWVDPHEPAWRQVCA